MIVGVDENAMFAARPVKAGTVAAPGLHQVSFLIELHNRRRRLAAFRCRRIDRSAFFVVGQRARPLIDPDMVMAVYRNAADLSEDPVVRQWLGPERIYAELRNALGANGRSHDQSQSGKCYGAADRLHFSPLIVVIRTGLFVLCVLCAFAVKRSRQPKENKRGRSARSSSRSG